VSQIDIGLPDENGRLEILRIHTKNMKLHEENDAEAVDLLEIAKETQGFVGADIAALCTEAAMITIRQKMHLIDVEKDGIDAEILASMAITKSAFKEALDPITPACKARQTQALPSGAQPAAAPEQRRAKHRFIVDDSAIDDNSVIGMHENTMTLLDIFAGDSVIVKGKKKKETVLVCTSDPSCEEGKIKVNGGTRKNLAVKLGDVVGIHKCDAIPYGTSVVVLPFADSIEGITGNLLEVWLKPYFCQTYRPVKVGDTFIVRGNTRAVEFKVDKVEVAAAPAAGQIKSEPAQYCIVSPETLIYCEGETLQRDDDDEMRSVGYDDIGGCREALALIREVVELPIRHPDLFKILGTKPPSGVLLFGPPGTGKTRIARAVANETDASFFVINGPEIMSGQLGKSEENLRSVFEKATESAPAIIFIDELDAIAPRRDGNPGQVECRVVSTLMACMDGMKWERSRVLVIGATNRPDAIDPSLRRFGRFDKEVRTCAQRLRADCCSRPLTLCVSDRHWTSR
jgi:transitional endoplasmic reticulum ATPase